MDLELVPSIPPPPSPCLVIIDVADVDEVDTEEGLIPVLPPRIGLFRQDTISYTNPTSRMITAISPRPSLDPEEIQEIRLHPSPMTSIGNEESRGDIVFSSFDEFVLHIRYLGYDKSDSIILTGLEWGSLLMIGITNYIGYSILIKKRSE